MVLCEIKLQELCGLMLHLLANLLSSMLLLCPHPGNAIMHLKALGFDNDEIRHRVVAYCPQVRSISFAMD